MSQCDTTFDLKINIFDGPVILLYILKTDWLMNMKRLDYETVWNLWPQNKCRSIWPIFQGPLILPYILTIWGTNIKLLDNVSVWHNLWP